MWYAVYGVLMGGLCPSCGLELYSLAGATLIASYSSLSQGHRSSGSMNAFAHKTGPKG